MTKENLEALVNGQRKAIETDIAWAQHELMLLAPYLQALKDKKSIAVISTRMDELTHDAKHGHLLLTTLD